MDTNHVQIPSVSPRAGSPKSAASEIDFTGLQQQTKNENAKSHRNQYFREDVIVTKGGVHSTDAVDEIDNEDAGEAEDDDDEVAAGIITLCTTLGGDQELEDEDNDEDVAAGIVTLCNTLGGDQEAAIEQGQVNGETYGDELDGRGYAMPMHATQAGSNRTINTLYSEGNANAQQSSMHFVNQADYDDVVVDELMCEVTTRY